MAVELVRHSDSRIDRQQLALFLNSYQRVAPLTIGELWAWPSMLKLALIENLRRLAAETMAARQARLEADAHVARLEGDAGDGLRALPPNPDLTFIVQLLHRLREYGVRLRWPRRLRRTWRRRIRPRRRRSGEHRHQAANQVFGGQRRHQPAPVFGIDWRQFVESGDWSSRCCSAIRPALRPDGLLSRDRQQAVEELGAERRRAVRVGAARRQRSRQAVAALPRIEPHTSAIT